MHKSSLLRMEWFVNNYLTSSVSQSANMANISVLDIGSYDVNGSYKQYFQNPAYSYTGLDMESGPNVDIVATTPYHWPTLKDESFDVVISGQALEHIEFFWFTFNEIVRVLKSEGLICIIAPRGFRRHRFPIDCYRFDTDGIVALAKYANLKIIHASTNLAPVESAKEWYSVNNADTMLIAEKPRDWQGFIDPKSYIFEQNDLEMLATGFVEMPSHISSPSPSNIPVHKTVQIRDDIVKALEERLIAQDKNIMELSNKIASQDIILSEINKTLVSQTQTIEANRQWIARYRYSYPYKIARKLRSLFRK